MERLEIWIDRTRCDGHRQCAELLPERIGLDDWGYPVMAAGTVPEDLLEHARRAVAACPVLALKLRRSSSGRPSASGRAQPALSRGR